MTGRALARLAGVVAALAALAVTARPLLDAPPTAITAVTVVAGPPPGAASRATVAARAALRCPPHPVGPTARSCGRLRVLRSATYCPAPGRCTVELVATLTGPGGRRPVGLTVELRRTATGWSATGMRS